MAEPTILHWLKSGLPSFEVIRQVSLFRQYKTGSPSSIPKNLDEPRLHGSTYTEGNSRRSPPQWLQHSEICANISITLVTNQVHNYSTAAETFKLVWNYNSHSGTKLNYTAKALLNNYHGWTTQKLRKRGNTEPTGVPLFKHHLPGTYGWSTGRHLQQNS